MRACSKVLLLAGGLLAVTATAALANVRAGDVSLTPMVGYHAFEGALQVDDSISYGLAVGYSLTGNWALELDARFTPTEADVAGGPDVDVWAGTLNALYHFNPDKALVPYLAFGAGGLQYDVEDFGRDEDVLANWGGGFKYAVADQLDLRLDLRHLLVFPVDSSLDRNDDKTARQQFSAMFGLNLHFGGVSGTPAKPAATPAPAVQPAVQTVAATAPAAIPAASRDGDRDGVLDSIDKCLDTAPGVRVDAAGCPADTDGDGVADYLDACVDTPEGARVDAQGCPFVVRPVETLTLHLLFATNRDQITPFHYRELERAHAFIQQYPGHDIVVEGHTDNRGNDAVNQELSRRRAENVVKVLVEKYGVPAERIAAKGYGEDQPVASNETAAGREQNRRVVIGIMP